MPTSASTRRDFLFSAVSGLPALALAGSARTAPVPRRLRTHLDREMRAGQIPGLQFAVVREARLQVLGHFGQADIENPSPVTATTLFQIASLTKAFVAVAVIQLADDGALALTDAVARHLPDLPAAWRTVTVGQLASHTSGLPDIVADLNRLRLVVDGDEEASWAKVQTMPPQSAPGERFSYNQTNYVLLGKLIERLRGESLAGVLRRRQFDVAGMPRTVFGDDRDVVPRSARTYTPYVFVDGAPRRTGTLYKVHTEFPPLLRGCGGLNSTAEEIARWLIALQRGALIRRANLPALETPGRLNDGSPAPWAFGVGIADRREHPVFYGVGAGKAAFGVYPRDGLAVVVLTNLSADMGVPFLDGVAAQYFAP